MLIIGNMRNLITSSFLSVYSCIWRTFITFLSVHIEDRRVFRAFDALLSIEERSMDGAVGDILILSTPAVVLIDDIIDGLFSEYPVCGNKIGLKDSGCKNCFVLAL